MRLVVLNDKAVGKVLAIPIYTQYGNVFMNKGSIFNEKTIFRIKKMGINLVYIEDGVNDITLNEVLDTGIKIKMLIKLKEIFLECQKTEKINEKAVLKIVEELIENVSVSENAYLYNNVSNEDELMELCMHSINVTILVIIMGYNKKYNQSKLTKLGLGALLHDIGKLFSKDKDHTTIGYKLMKDNVFFSATSYCVPFGHHENEDGSGYPQKAIGERIHEYTKIVSICNEYLNILSIGEIMLPHEVIETLAAMVPQRFNSEIYADFVSSIYCYPNGLTVRLNNGTEAVVIQQNKGFPARPFVAFKENGEVTLSNLMNNLTLFVKEIVM